jgi:hypothetical protein
MTKVSKYQKFDVKGKGKNFNNYYMDEENVTIKDIKRDQNHKRYRNYDNILKSKNVNALMEYEDN